MAPTLDVLVLFFLTSLQINKNNTVCLETEKSEILNDFSICYMILPMLKRGMSSLKSCEYSLGYGPNGMN